MSNSDNNYDINGYFLIPIKKINISDKNRVDIKEWISTYFQSHNQKDEQNEFKDYFLKKQFLYKMFNLETETAKNQNCLIQSIYQLEKIKNNFSAESDNKNDKKYDAFILNLNLNFLKINETNSTNSKNYLAIFVEQNKSENEETTNEDLNKEIKKIKKEYGIVVEPTFSSFQIEKQNLISNDELLFELWNNNSNKIIAELSNIEDTKIIFSFAEKGINKQTFQRFNSTYKLIHLFFYIFEFFRQEKALDFFSGIDMQTNKIKSSITELETDYKNWFLDGNNNESINKKIWKIKNDIDNLESYILDFRNWLFHFSENIFSKHNQVNNFFKKKYEIHNIEKTISNWENELNKYKEIFLNFNKRIEKIENNLLSITKKIDNYYEIKNKGKNLFFNIIIYIVSAFLGVCSLFQVIQGFSLEKELTFNLILSISIALLLILIIYWISVLIISKKKNKIRLENINNYLKETFDIDILMIKNKTKKEKNK